MDILENVILHTVRVMALPHPHPIYLVQDNCSIHRARVVDEWFGEHPEIIRLFRPPRSPDFNPIENIWACLVNKWNEANERSRDALERHSLAV